MMRRKLAYVICLISVFVINIFYVNYEFYVILLLLVFMPLCSFLMFLIAKYQVDMYLGISKNMVHMNEQLKVHIRLQNKVPVLLANSVVFITVGCSNVNLKEHTSQNINAFLDKYQKKIRIYAAHSGIYTIQADKIEMYDYLRMFHARKRFRGVTQIPVFPLLLPSSERVNEDVLDGMELNRDEWIILNGDSDEIADLRTYENGDSMNRIHWKLSVKTDDLIVKKYGDIEDKIIRILIDLSLYESQDFRDHLDKVYQMAYSIGNYYIRHEVKGCFIIWDDAARKLMQYDFFDTKSLRNALVLVMKQPCRENVGGRTYSAFEESGIRFSEKPYWITTQNYESSKYQVVNVVKDDLDLMMEKLYKM